jgi:hypothetical protein
LNLEHHYIRRTLNMLGKEAALTMNVADVLDEVKLKELDSATSIGWGEMDYGLQFLLSAVICKDVTGLTDVPSRNRDFLIAVLDWTQDLKKRAPSTMFSEELAMCLNDIQKRSFEQAEEHASVAKEILRDMRAIAVPSLGSSYRSLTLFGSAPNYLSISGTSDVDMSLRVSEETGSSSNSSSETFDAIIAGLSRSSAPTFTVTELVSEAKVPVLKLKHCGSGSDSSTEVGTRTTPSYAFQHRCGIRNHCLLAICCLLAI